MQPQGVHPTLASMRRRRALARGGLAIAAVLVGATLTACGPRQNDPRKPEFDGMRFSARLTATRDNPRDFTVVVSPASANVSAAQEAGRYEATKYCLQTFGGSDTIWGVGPDLPVEQVTVAGDAITMTGRCTQRA